MGFGPRSYRQFKKVRGRKYSSYGELTRFIYEKEGKKRLDWEGKRELEKKRIKLQEKQKMLERHQRKAFLKDVQANPIRFKTSDGSKVRILRHVFENIFAGTRHNPRALALVFVNGKKIFFYKSSGESSKRPGKWLPTMGPTKIVDYEKNDFKLDWLEKVPGHYIGEKPVLEFAPWVNEVSQKLKQSENRLKFHLDWNKHTYVKILELFKVIPFTEKKTDDIW
ncbi:MAG: hypothetical protein AB1467_02860 [Candidatus Diapherotrites archaeon]